MKNNKEKTPQAVQPGQVNNSSSLDEIKKARTRAAVSVFINLTLAFGKGIAGVLAGSSALLGDAINSATDVIASAAAYMGLWLAGRRHASFPYGLYKAETIATLVTSIAIILAGYEIGRRALLGPGTMPDVKLALPVALASLVVSFSFGFYQLRMGRRLHSPALVADARDYLADGMSTGVVVISLIGAYFGLNLDRWAAGAVALFVFWSGGQLLWRALRDLMDEAIDRDAEREIIGLVMSHPRVGKVEQCLSRTAGGRFIVDLDVVLRTHSHELAHRIAHSLEHEICRQFPRVVMARIKTHSRQPEHIRRLTPVKEPGGVIADHFAKAPWFLMETIERVSNKIIREENLQNPYWQAETRRGFLVGKWLLELKPDQVVLPRDKEGTAAALLKEAGVEIKLAKNAKVKNV
ncbi:MAG: cation diffusion facilitator family transporter [Deltaproteobacteria bacterium]|nr:cation diffusion facilitator family transporter [Deltaproteobacteria bacterium]